MRLALVGAVLHAAPAAEPAPRIHAVTAPFGEVRVVARADVPRALREGKAARLAARRFLGLDVPPFGIVEQRLAGRSPGRSTTAFTFYWPFRDLPPPRGRSLSTDSLLRHEIGHDLFTRFLVPRTGGNQYGSDAPDWLDEMAAVAFEDESEGCRRRTDAGLRARRGGLIPLARFLGMSHPEWSAGSSGLAPPLGAVVIESRSPETAGFYATVRVLLDFLLDRLGAARTIPGLAAEARAGRPLDRWLLGHVARDRAGGLAGLDSEISAFIRSDPRYSRVRTCIDGG